jgi:hypothetical protein
MNEWSKEEGKLVFRRPFGNGPSVPYSYICKYPRMATAAKAAAAAVFLLIQNLHSRLLTVAMAEWAELIGMKGSGEDNIYVCMGKWHWRGKEGRTTPKRK